MAATTFKSDSPGILRSFQLLSETATGAGTSACYLMFTPRRLCPLLSPYCRRNPKQSTPVRKAKKGVIRMQFHRRTSRKEILIGLAVLWAGGIQVFGDLAQLSVSSNHRYLQDVSS